MTEQQSVESLLHESLMATIEVPKLPENKVYLDERKFHDAWLPLFLSYFAGKDEGAINEWHVRVAGSPYQKVSVCTDTSRPEETTVFVVPPLLDNDFDIISSEAQSQVATIFEKAELNNKNFPGSGDSYITGLIGKVVDMPKSNANEEAWKKIYRYYNIDAPFLHENTETKTQSTNKQLNELVEDWDDDF